jgi:succinyl-diaminopimelate desuccinylase
MPAPPPGSPDSGLSAPDPAEAIALAEALIRLPTPNPPGGEHDLATFLVDWLRRRGVAAETRAVDVEGARANSTNVFARVPGRGDRAPLVLCGHLDTVPAGEGAWQRDPFVPVVEDGRLYGLGAADMKAAVAAMAVVATRVAASKPLAGHLLLAFTSGEETRSCGARAFVQSGLLAGAAGLVIGEPTGNRVGIAEKGGLWLELVAHGQTSHGSRPDLGVNAAAGLAELVHAIELAAAPAAPAGPAGTWPGASRPLQDAVAALDRILRAPAHPLLGAPTLTVTRLSGGVANNVVPDRASATFDVRLLPGQDAASVRDAVEQVARAVLGPRNLRLETIDMGTRVPLDVPAEHPLVVATRAAVEAALGQPAETYGLTGATDATELVPPLGLPFVICGPGEMAQAHQPDEFVSLAALAASVEIYTRLVQRILG